MIARRPVPLLAMLLGAGVMFGPPGATAAEPGHALAERFAAGAAKEEARRKADETKRRQAEDAKRRKAEETEMLARARAEALERKAAADRARAEEDAQEAARIAEHERTEKARRLAEEQRIARERFIAEQVRAEEERQRRAEEERLAEELRVAEEQRAAAQKRAEETRAREAARIAAEKRIAEEKRAAEQQRAEEERQRIALEQRRANERQIAEQKRADDERKRAEAVRIAERITEQRRIAAQERDAEQHRLALAAEREASHERRAERLRQLESERSAKGLAALENPMSLGAPRSEAPASVVAPYVAARSLANTSIGRTLPSKSAERVTILLVMKPGATGIRRFGKKTADAVLCSGANCWIGAGTGRAARAVTRGLALGPANTMGGRAGACNRRLSCVYRDVDLRGASASIQPIDLRVVRHDRREPLRLEADRSCRIAHGALVCDKTYASRSWRAWVIDEELARKAGPAALAAALDSGLVPATRPRSTQEISRAPRLRHGT